MLTERPDDGHLAAGDPGVSEEGQTAGEVQVTGVVRVGAEGRNDTVQPNVRRLAAHLLEHQSPQVGLPRQIGGQLSVKAVALPPGAPVRDHAGTLEGIVGEESREPTSHGIPPAAAQLALDARHPVTKMGRQGVCPPFRHGGIERTQDRPGELFGVPRVVALDAQHERHERVRVEEADTGTDAVVAPGASPQTMRESLGQPALDTFGRHRDDLGREGVVERVAQQLGEAVGQSRGARRPVHGQGHGLTLTGPTDVMGGPLAALRGYRGNMHRLPVMGPAPEWDVSQWLGPEPPARTLGGLRGKVVVIEAFQMLCPGCVSHGIPLAKKVHASVGDEVVVIGLHSVFEHHEAMTPVSLAAFLHEYRVTFPVAVDRPEGTGMPATMRTYGLQGTPSMLVIDKSGMLRANAFGAVDEVALGVQLGLLLAEPDPRGQEPESRSSD